MLATIVAVAIASPSTNVADAARSLTEALKLDKKTVVLVAPATGGPAALAKSVEEELLRALARAGVPVVDRQALRAALGESQQQAELGQSELRDLAGGFGAKLILTVTLSERGAKVWVVNASLVHAVDGKIKATARAELAGGEDAGADEAVTLYAQLRRLADKLARGLDALSGEARYQSFAVLPFAETGASTQEKSLGLLVASEITTLLHRDHGLLLVERSQLERILGEMALGQTGVIDETSSIEVGKLAGAQALIIGTVVEAGDRYLVNAKIVSVKEGTVTVAEQVQLPAADLVALSSEAVVLRSRAGAVYRSLLLPGWGQLYNRQGLKGGIFAGAEAAAAGLAVAYHLLGAQKQKEYESIDGPRDPAVFIELSDQAASRYRMRNVFIWAALGIHALNVIDALLYGQTFESPTLQRGGALGRSTP